MGTEITLIFAISIPSSFAVAELPFYPHLSPQKFVSITIASSLVQQSVDRIWIQL